MEAADAVTRRLTVRRHQRLTVQPADESAANAPSWSAKGARSGEAWIGRVGEDGEVSEGAI
jgi:hypothetical protein